MNPHTVLLAVADLFFLSKLKTALEAQGCVVRVSTQLQPLLQQAVDLKPDLMILDLGIATLDPALLLIRAPPDSPAQRSSGAVLHQPYPGSNLGGEAERQCR